MVDRRQALAALTAPGEPYELEPVQLYGRTCRGFKNAPPTLRELYEDNRSELDFFVYGDERYTFERTWQLASRIGALLADVHDVQKGDRVAISMRNYPEWVTSFFAVTSIGAVAVPMNALWQPDEMAYGLTDSGAKVLLADQERLDRLAQCTAPPHGPGQGLTVLAVRPSRALPPGVLDLGEALQAVADNAQMPRRDVHPNDDATILYTSGSTGHPKGAVSCHRNILSALLSWELDIAASAMQAGVEAAKPTAQPVTLLAVPLFHATGCHAVFLASIRSQRRIISMRKWDVEVAAELIERERVTSFIAPAAMTGDLIEFAGKADRDLGSLAAVGGGGAHRAPEQVASIEKAFTAALPRTGWGMTETNAIGASIAGQDYLTRPASSGRCSAVLDMRIVDDAGHELAPGERGEVQVRGTSIIRGYWQRPDADEASFIDGWLRTGDVAYLDEEGFVFIVDRIKDLVIRGGENIGCGAVESALLEHPAVVEASVYAVPDDRLGEEIGATLFTKEPVEEGALREFLGPRLARFEIPRYFHFSDGPLPRTASGKVLKRDLQAQAIARIAG